MSKKDITEIKSFSSPPEKIVTIMKGLSFALGYKCKSLTEIKKNVMGTHLISSLLNYDKENMDYLTCKRVYNKIKDMSEDEIKKVKLQFLIHFFPFSALLNHLRIILLNLLNLGIKMRSWPLYLAEKHTLL